MVSHHKFFNLNETINRKTSARQSSNSSAVIQEVAQVMEEIARNSRNRNGRTCRNEECTKEQINHLRPWPLKERLIQLQLKIGYWTPKKFFEFCYALMHKMFCSPRSNEQVKWNVGGYQEWHSWNKKCNKFQSHGTILKKLSLIVSSQSPLKMLKLGNSLIWCKGSWTCTNMQQDFLSYLVLPLIWFLIKRNRKS